MSESPVAIEHVAVDDVEQDDVSSGSETVAVDVEQDCDCDHHPQPCQLLQLVLRGLFVFHCHVLSGLTAASRARHRCPGLLLKLISAKMKCCCVVQDGDHQGRVSSS